MAINKDTTNLMELLPICMSHQDLMLSISEWLCQELRETKILSIRELGRILTAAS